MKSRENKSNLQMWIDNDFRKQFEETARKNGFVRWQSFAETLFQLAVAGDIKLKPPQLVESGVTNEPA